MRIVNKTTPVAHRARAAVMLHGESGSGKTTFAVTGGRPFVICLESKAEAVINLLNPDAIIVTPESIDDLREIGKALRAPTTPESIKAFPGIEKATRIVLDSWTELTAMIAGFIGGGAQISLQQYGELQRICFGLLGMMQSGPLPSIIIARSELQESGNGIMRTSRIVPASLGKSVNMLPGKLVATLQAVGVNDQGDMFMVESGPSDTARRSGLPWLKSSWSPITDGDSEKMLAVIEAGPKRAA